LHSTNLMFDMCNVNHTTIQKRKEAKHLRAQQGPLIGYIILYMVRYTWWACQSDSCYNNNHTISAVFEVYWWYFVSINVPSIDAIVANLKIEIDIKIFVFSTMFPLYFMAHQFRQQRERLFCWVFENICVEMLNIHGIPSVHISKFLQNRKPNPRNKKIPKCT